MYLFTDLLPFDLSATPTPSLFLSHLLYFLLPYFSRISVLVPLYTCLLVILLAISFLAVFAIVSQLFLGFFYSSTFGFLFTASDAQMYNRLLGIFIPLALSALCYLYLFEKHAYKHMSNCQLVKPWCIVPLCFAEKRIDFCFEGGNIKSAFSNFSLF